MQSRSIQEINDALWHQAFLGDVGYPVSWGPVVAVRRRKGRLLAMVRGWGRWYPVESVTIEGWFIIPAVKEPTR
jgi:hypothetical protein